MLTADTISDLRNDITTPSPAICQHQRELLDMNAETIIKTLKACENVNKLLNRSPFVQSDEALTAAATSLVVASKELVKQLHIVFHRRA